MRLAKRGLGRALAAGDTAAGQADLARVVLEVRRALGEQDGGPFARSSSASSTDAGRDGRSRISRNAGEIGPSMIARSRARGSRGGRGTRGGRMTSSVLTA